MLELPAGVIVSGFMPTPVDYGFSIEPSTGAEINRQDRKGNRYAVVVEIAPMRPDLARVVVSRLMRARYEGLQLPYVLQVSQGSPGSVQVNGADQAGTSLLIKNATPGYVCKEGYWLSIENAAGRHYLHNVAASATVAGDGTATLTLCEQLRHEFANNAAVHIAKPMIGGLVMGDEMQWQLSIHQAMPISFILMEAE